MLGQIAWNPDGRSLCMSSSDNSATVWDMGTGAVTHTLCGHSGGCLLWLGAQMVPLWLQGHETILCDYGTHLKVLLWACCNATLTG